MNFSCSAAKSFLRVLAILSTLLMVLPAWTQSGSETLQPGKNRKAKAMATQQAGDEKAGTPRKERKRGEKGQDTGRAAGLSKAEIKAKKQQLSELRQQQKAAGILPAKRVPPILPPVILPPKPTANPWQLAEDFDWNVNWEQQDNRGVHKSMDYGYSGTNNLSAAQCAPGEIGGSVSGGGISWFADNVAGGPVMLDPSKDTLNASGWCKFDATAGNAALGWFNADSYSAPDSAPDCFIGWRQNGDALCAAIGADGSSFADGKPIAISSGSPVQWTLAYTPTGGDSGCGLVTLSAGGSSSTLSLTQEQSKALAAGKLNRFGIVSANTGADKISTVWLDNLIYTRISSFMKPHSEATAHTRTTFFDTNPTSSTWFAVNNMVPHDPVLISQDYGYRSTGGRSGGCIGGTFTQGIGISYYGYDYGDKMLHLTDKLRSEGWFQIPNYEGHNVHFGWTSKKGNSWREPSTLGIRVVNMRGKAHSINVYAEFCTKTYEGKGGENMGVVATIEAGPQWHHYVLEYDPGRPADPGTLSLQINDTTKTFTLSEGKKNLGADIDLFSMWNAKVPAEDRPMTVFLDDVTNTVNGRRDPSSSDFNTNPAGWVGVNNSFSNKKDYIVRAYHQFGWAKDLLYLDGQNGFSPMYTIEDRNRYCMGGIIYLASFFNTNVPRAYYGAGLNGTFNARDHHLFATGRIKIDWATVDAAELFGWFDSKTACDDVTGGKGHMFPNKFLGVAIHGGASTGYYAAPGYRSPHLPEEHLVESKNAEYREAFRRVYQDGQWREFTMEYDPDGAGGNGQIKVQLGSGNQPYTFDLEPGAKGENTDFSFDRFGLLTMRKGGGKPHAIFFDKLTYTVLP